MIRITPALARRLEEAEAKSYGVWWERTGPDEKRGLIPRQTTVGSTTCLRATTGALAIWNRAHGFGMGAEPTAADLVAIREIFAPTADWVLDLNPYADHVGAAMDLLHDGGFRPFTHSNILAARPEDVPEPTGLPGVEVVRVEKEHLDGLLHVNAVGYEMPAAEVELLRTGAESMLGRPDAHFYLALVGGRPASVAELHLHENGVGFFAGAATLPEYRGQGLQTLLIRTRAREARRLGCEMLGVQTGVGTQSQYNQEANGFRLTYTKTGWRI